MYPPVKGYLQKNGSSCDRWNCGLRESLPIQCKLQPATIGVFFQSFPLNNNIDCHVPLTQEQDEEVELSQKVSVLSFTKPVLPDCFSAIVVPFSFPTHSLDNFCFLFLATLNRHNFCQPNYMKFYVVVFMTIILSFFLCVNL